MVVIYHGLGLSFNDFCSLLNIPAQRKKLRGKNKCFIFAVKKFYDYET